MQVVVGIKIRVVGKPTPAHSAGYAEQRKDVYSFNYATTSQRTSR